MTFSSLKAPYFRSIGTLNLDMYIHMYILLMCTKYILYIFPNVGIQSMP